MEIVQSKYQRAIYQVFTHSKRNLNISAVAGSGKTTTLLELLKYIPEGSDTLFLAFNNSIVDELKERNEREDARIMTIHSCGWRSILQCYGSKSKVNPNKAMAKTEITLKRFNVTKRRGWYFYAIPKMLDLMRCNLCKNTVNDIVELSEYYDVDIDGRDAEMVMYAYELMRKDKRQFDFMDMIYVPITDVNIYLQKYDYVFCDESQDFSVAQHEFIKRCLNRRGRLITVGDKRQAIYGFAGADAESYDKLAELNGTALRMPLSICYRCGKNIVMEAKKIVPEIQYNPEQISGVVRDGNLTEVVDGDWILCRNLKPLIQTYLWLIQNHKKCKIRGKDIAEGILALINKMGVKTLSGLSSALEREQERVFDKLVARGVKKPNNHPKMELLSQKIDVIETLADEVETVEELKQLINNIFDDKEKKGIILSTIHKSKGLENERIFFLLPNLIPSRYAVQDWQLEQEQNLLYVAITRAKRELVYIKEGDFVWSLAQQGF